MSEASGIPELQGKFQQPNHTIHDSMDGVVLGDLQQIEQRGEWLSGELRVVHHPHGSAVLYGDCLAGSAAIDAALETALTTHAPEALTRLPGSYTTLLFEPERMTALGDLANQYPLYYRHDGNGIAYGSTTKPLRESMRAPQPDRLALAGRLALGLPTDLIAGRTATEGVNRLDGGHKLTVDRRTNTTATEPYETFDTPDIKTIDEAAALLREALLEAAQLRAQSGQQLSADFSGGLDSTTGAYLLARETNQPLLVSTKYTAGTPSADLEQARRLLALPASRGLFDAHEYAQLAEKSVYEDLRSAPESDEPDSALPAHNLEQAYCTFLRDKGSRLHINGSGADSLLDADPTLYLGDWARPGSYARFMRGTAEAARLAKSSPLHIAKQSLIRARLTPSHDLDAVSRILRGAKDPRLLLQGSWLFGLAVAPQWLTDPMRKELADLAAARADAMRNEPQTSYANHIAYASIKDAAYEQVGMMRRAADMGLRQRAIYMDHPVIRACLSIPASMRLNPWTFKAILVKATEGLIPPEVTQRGTKGDYTQQAVQGLRDALPELQYLLRHSRLAEMGVINPKAVQETLDRLPLHTALPWQSLDTFIATELWLRDQDIHNPGSPPPLAITPQAPEAVVPIADETIVSMPPDALLVTFDNGGASLQLARKKYYRHNRYTVSLIEALQQSQSFGAVIDRYIADNPAMPPEVIRSMVGQEVRKLLDAGILAEGKGTFSISKASANRMPSAAPMTRQNQERAKARLRDYPAAVGGFVLAMALMRLPLGAQTRALASIHRHWAKRPDSQARAAHTLAAVQTIAELYPARAACYEITAATALAAALGKKRINLTLGVSSDMALFHAWPETNGVAIRTARDPEIAGIFEPILSV